MDATERARELALRYIDFQARTSSEVRRRLARAGWPEEVVEEVVAGLEKAGILDDAQFSRDWVESRSRRKGLGASRLAAELRRKGVVSDQVAEAVSAVDPEAELTTARELALARLRGGSVEDPDVRRRLAAYLQRRGYKWGTIEQVIANLAENRE